LEYHAEYSNQSVVEDFVEVINFNFNELAGVQRTFQGPLKVLMTKQRKTRLAQI